MLTEEQLQDIFELADLLSDGNRDLFIHLREVVFASDPNHILDLVERLLDAASFDAFLDRIGESEKDNLWLILLTLLDHFGYIRRFKRTGELTDFINKVDQLPQVREAGISLKLDSEGLQPAASAPEWAAVVDSKYAAENYCLGAIARTSNSFYLFFAKLPTFSRVQTLAKNLGYRVDYAKYM